MGEKLYSARLTQKARKIPRFLGLIRPARWTRVGLGREEEGKVREETDAWGSAGGERRGWDLLTSQRERGRRARACLAAWWAALTGRGRGREPRGTGLAGVSWAAGFFPLFFFFSVFIFQDIFQKSF